MIRVSEQDSGNSVLGDLMPDLTPMLDILFILLVFFMLTAGVVFQSLDLNLPSNVEESVPVLDAPKQIMVEIRKDDFAVDGNRIETFDAFKTAIQVTVKEKPDHEVIIAGDQKVVIGRLLRVLTYLQTQGINAANILMQNEEKK